MSIRVNPDLRNELIQFGIGDWNACYHCGTCTAICPLSEEGFLFPRKKIRLMQMGLQGPLESSVEPWLCYYCGDCTKTCPRDANPGELMMSLRRYLTSTYDWTGLSKKFYTSKIWELAWILFFAALVIISFLVILPSFGYKFTTELTAEGGVKLNSFAPIPIIEAFDWIMAIIVATLLISNILRMYYKIIWKNSTTKVSLWVHIREFWLLIFNFAVQPKFSKCDDKRYWGAHWFLMSGYTIMFIVIVVFLPWFQTEKILPVWDPQRWLGYYATFGLLFGLVIAIFGRLKKKDIKFRFSHVSDWLFLVMLTLTVITGIFIHIFRINGMPMATYVSYITHMAVLVPMILIEVPFSKWSHLAYRPFAVYFTQLKKNAVLK
ncbi:MAG: 4Fe-4S dicluster domain-containing protein [Bacteroidales bacterium]|jgi:ferredoxin|nr:4Fe-4S dicluster domain-containing protein [Bacteroidales bacterium]